MDTGQDIEVPDKMTIAELEAKQEDTENRFSWSFTQNARYVDCVWRNFYKTSTGKRSKDTNGAWKLLPLQKKVVELA